MNRTEFIQRAAIALWSNPDSSDPSTMWRLAIRLADAMPPELAGDVQRIHDLQNAIVEIREMLNSLSSGIDVDADPHDECPEDNTQFVGGLIYQACNRALAGSGLEEI